MKKFDLIFDIDGDAIEGEYFEMIAEMCKHGKHLIDDFLIKDFGISLDDIRIEFSGKKGLHVTVLSEEHKRLSKEARRQLFYYIEGSQVDKAILFPERKGHIVAMPNAKGVGESMREERLKHFLEIPKESRKKRLRKSS